MLLMVDRHCHKELGNSECTLINITCHFTARVLQKYPAVKLPEFPVWFSVKQQTTNSKQRKQNKKSFFTEYGNEIKRDIMSL